jgi:hypothetical protein
VLRARWGWSPGSVTVAQRSLPKGHLLALQRPAQQGCLGRITFQPGLGVRQYLLGGEDRCGHERDQVQRVTRPGVHQLCARCALHLNGGTVTRPAADGWHQPVNPHLLADGSIRSNHLAYRLCPDVDAFET